MKRIKVRWDFFIEKKLSYLFKDIVKTNLDDEKQEEKTFVKIHDLLLKFSIKNEKKLGKKIDVDEHERIVNQELEEIYDYITKNKEYIKEKQQSKDIDIIAFRKKQLKRAKLKARSVEGNVYSKFVREISIKYTDLYIWCTVGDDRVRETHAIRDGNIYRISSKDIVPGEEYYCRCWCEFII